MRVAHGLATAGVATVLAVATSQLYGDESYPVFSGGGLDTGRGIWLENCLGCHGDGTADAPRPSRYGEWETRVEQQREVLYRHAIDGFFGPDYSMMPPRGGNEDLSDAQVMAAVDYMLRLVEHFRQAGE